MNVIEKHEKPFIYTGIILNTFIAYQFCVLWLSPNIDDAPKILSFASLMAFEFVMVHSGLFMAFMPRRISLFILVPFYGIFALIFTAIAKDSLILISYLLVIINRLRYAFSDVSKEMKGQLIIRSIGAMAIYFCLIFIILIFQGLIPEIGLNTTFLNTSGYYNILTSSGVFVETPHIAIVFGMLYYILLAIFEAYMIPGKVETSNIDNTVTVFKRKRFNYFKTKKRIRK